jgi:rhamnosyltransferase
MRIAIIGSRGIPAKYGGFETFAEGLSTRLVKNGFEITVSCEYEPLESRIAEFNDVKLEYFPFKPPKNYFLRMFYENLSDIYFLIKLTRSHDLIYFLGIEVGFFLFIPKLIKNDIKLLVNIDGLMWKRTKFNKFARFLLKLNHYFATVFANTIITDAEEMKNYIPDIYKNKAVYIPYGVELPKLIPWTNKKVKNYDKIKDISTNNYWLVVARLEPENNISTIIDAYSKFTTKLPLIVIGEYTSDKYKKQIDRIAENSDNIIFLGSIYDLTTLDMLRQNCFAYIHGHSVGGTNPSLLEAMIMKNIIIAHDNEFNREVCGDLGIYFTDVDDLINKLDLIENNFSSYIKLKEELHDRAKEKYSWKDINNNYIKLFEREFGE